MPSSAHRWPATVHGRVAGAASLSRARKEFKRRLRVQDMKTVIFACVHNAGRSQMAAAFFNRLANPAKGRALSAGTRPADQVHPEVLTVMQEEGIDLTGVRPQRLTPTLAAQAQLLITMGCGDECPYVPGLRRDDWRLQDPKGRPVERVRMIRDEIRALVEKLIAEEGVK
jgi:arsenate reductase